MKRFRLIEMFEDDATHELSMSRFLCFVIVLYCFASMWGKDIPLGWAGLVTALYFANKGASTVLKKAEMANEPAVN